MLILWTDKGQERAARFQREDEARNFIHLLKTRHGAQHIQLLDEDGVRLEATLPFPDSGADSGVTVVA
jgi:hypothetical protein